MQGTLSAPTPPDAECGRAPRPRVGAAPGRLHPNNMRPAPPLRAASSHSPPDPPP